MFMKLPFVKLLICSAFSSASIFLTFSPAFADSIGSNYSCNGSELKLKNKVVTLGSAKSAVTKQLNTAKAQLKSAKKGSKAQNKLKLKVAALKATIADIKSCAAGTYVQEIFETISKSYATGTWNNTTFSTSGGLSANLALSGSTLSVSLNIGGMMFGSLAPAPIEFQQDVAGVTFPFQFTKTGTTIGDLTVTFQSDGSFAVEESTVPSLPNILRATLSTTYTNGSYSGTFHSFLAGNVQLAEGTMSLSQ